MRYIEKQGRQSQDMPEAEVSEIMQQQAESQSPASQATSSMSLIKLPNEMLYEIVSHLDLPERILLALTCKLLMSLVFPDGSLPRLDSTDQSRLLLVLQRDIPMTFLCTWCSKLQRLNPELNWRSQDHHELTFCSLRIAWLPNSMWRNFTSGLHDHIILPRDWQTFMGYGYIRFMDAHLIMNRHFYGALHGISLRHLTRCVSFETELALDRCLHDEFGNIRYRERAETEEEPTFDWIPAEHPRRNGVWRFSLRYTPKIIDDTLYLARSFTFVGPNVPWINLARLMNGIKPKVCNHMSCTIVMDPVYSPIVQCARAGEFDFEFSPETKTNWRACGFNPGTGSCLICKTDYDVSLTQHFLKEEWRFSCNTYHCLGQCQTMGDPFWDCFIYDSDERIGIPSYGGRAFTDDGSNELVSTYGDVRRKFLGNATKAEIL